MPRKPTATDESDSLAAEPADYASALQSLEGLIAELESGQLPLEQLLAGYQRGARLLGYCRSRLEAVEQQVKVLEDGELKPWGAAA